MSIIKYCILGLVIILITGCPSGVNLIIVNNIQTDSVSEVPNWIILQAGVQ